LFERREGSVLFGLIVIFLLGAFLAPSRFLTLNNLAGVLRQASTTAFIGFGVGLLMVTSEFDLSVGSMYGLSAALTALLIGSTELGLDPLFALVVILVFAAIFGVTQGLIVTKMALPSLIVTIGTLTLVRGVQRIFIGGTTVAAASEDMGILYWIGGNIQVPRITYQIPGIHERTQEFSQFSIQIIWVFILLALFHYILHYTRFGAHVRATGDNVNSVDTTGIDPEIIKLGAFAICSVMAAFAGMSFLARFGSVSSSTGNGLALIVIAAVVLGGTKLTGGEGSMVGVFLGAVVLAIANNILTLIGLNISGWNGIIQGGFIIAAIGLDVIFKGFSYQLLQRWYFEPIIDLLRSPRHFFAEVSEQMTTDEIFGFLAVTVGITGILTNLFAAIIGLVLDVSGFRLFLAGGWPETMAQAYLFLGVVGFIGFFGVSIGTKLQKGSGDYVSNLMTICYGLAPAPLFAVPMATLGFDIAVVGTELLTSFILAIPAVVLIQRTIYSGVTETHDLSRGETLRVLLVLNVIWFAALLFVGRGLTTPTMIPI
jgi:ribose/xylose/arabinose/galactoside ABC-type transport system permease subunit